MTLVDNTRTSLGRQSGFFFTPEFFYAVIILVTPYLLFYWMLPFISDMTLGSDYINYHIYHHLDLMFSIKSGSFPLFAPECFYGQSAAAYTQAQIYHPLTYIASILPGYWHGLSLEWFTLLRLITLSLCQFMFFRLFLRFKLYPLVSLLLSTIITYNLSMLVLFWNGSSLEAYTGFLFLTASIALYFLSPRQWGGRIGIIFSTYWLMTSGYPPMTYYGMIGAILFTGIIPFFASTVVNLPPVRLSSAINFWCRTGGFIIIGGLLSAAYLSPFFFDFMADNSGRIDQSYQWAIALNDTFIGFINNFFYPLRSGFSMFTGSPLFLTASVVPAAVLFRYKIPKHIYSIVLIITTIALYIQGDRTPVHFWIWKHLPLASSIRMPSYAAMLLPLFLTMLLIWIIKAPPLTIKKTNGCHSLSLLSLLSLIALIATISYWILPDAFVKNAHFSCPYNLRAIPPWVEPALLGSSCLFLLLLSIYPFFTRKYIRTGCMALLVITFIQLALFFRWAPLAIEKKPLTPSYQEILNEKRQSINFQKIFFLNGGLGDKIVINQLKKYFVEPYLGTIYKKILIAPSLQEAYDILNHDRKPPELVITGSKQDDLSRRRQSSTMTEDQVSLIYSAYNRLIFKTEADQSAYFVCSYPYTGHWKAWVNNKPAKIYHANGSAQAVKIPPGSSTVEFRYWSWAAFWGMLVSCLTLALAGSIFCLRGLKYPIRYFIAAIPTITAVGLFLFWYNSLYSGQNLHTNYHWQSSQRTTDKNLAFGKPTKMSSHRRDYPYRYNSRHAVDGDTTAASCFITNMELTPWWMVDLQEVQSVKKIIIWPHSLKNMPTNYMPFIISISENGKNWVHTTIDEPSGTPAIHVNFKKRERARFVGIQAAGKCILSLNEVMVF